MLTTLSGNDGETRTSQTFVSAARIYRLFVFTESKPRLSVRDLKSVVWTGTDKSLQASSHSTPDDVRVSLLIENYLYRIDTAQS